MKLLFLTIILAMLSFGAMAEQVTLTKENSVSLRSAVMTSSVAKAISDLSELEKNKEPVLYLVLDTPGGSVFAGLQLINYLKNFKKPVKTVTVFAASMGFQIAHGNPGPRLISYTGILMGHPMSGGIGGELGTGMSADNRHGFLKEIIETMDKEVVERTNGKQTLDSYKKSYDNELWTTGQNAIQQGYADSVVSLSCDTEMVNSFDKTQYREYMQQQFSIEIKYEISKCPMIDDLAKFQLAIVDITTEKKFILYNKGYDLDSSGSDLLELRSGKRFSEIPDNIIQMAEKTEGYKNFMFLMTRDMEIVKKLKKF